MGQKNSIAIRNHNDFDIRNWEEDAVLTNEMNGLYYGDVKVLQHHETKELIDKYELFFSSKEEFELYIKSFEFRSKEKHIVPAYHLIPHLQNQYCSTIYQASIFFDHPKNRLSDFKDIPHPDNLYCLTAMLKGYHKLFEHTGQFPISEEQICIDELGCVQVWINRDMSKNYPEEYLIQPQPKDPEEEEEDMVEEIIKVISENTDAQCEPEPSFLEFYERNRSNMRIKFEQALSLIDEYAELTKVPVPDYFVSVVEIYGDQDELYEDMNEGDIFTQPHQNRNQESQASSRSQQLYQGNEPIGSRQVMGKSQSPHITDRSKQRRKSQINNQLNRSHQLSSISSNHANELNLYENEYTQQPTNAYKTNNNDSKIWTHSQQSRRPSTQNNFPHQHATGQGQHYELKDYQLNDYQLKDYRLKDYEKPQVRSDIEQEAAIREEQLRRISENHSSINRLTSELNHIFSDSRNNTRRPSQNSQAAIVPISRQHSENIMAQGSHNNSGFIVPNAAIHEGYNYQISSGSYNSENAQKIYEKAHPHLKQSSSSGHSTPRHLPNVTYSPDVNLPLPDRAFEKKSRGSEQYAPLCYDTVDEMIEIDPEIAADMLIYI